MQNSGNAETFNPSDRRYIEFTVVTPSTTKKLGVVKMMWLFDKVPACGETVSVAKLFDLKVTNCNGNKWLDGNSVALQATVTDRTGEPIKTPGQLLNHVMSVYAFSRRHLITLYAEVEDWGR